MNRAAEDVMTVEDYRAMPEGPPYYQLIEGELIMSPSPNRFHQTVLANVFRILDAFVRQRSLGVVYFAPMDVYLAADTVVQPDILYVSNANRQLLAEDGVHGGPDLVVEVISPSNGPLEKRRKRPLYARHGVKEEWLIDPHLEQIHRYDFTADTAKPVRIVDSEETFETSLFPGLLIHATDVFKR
jgi:Uma2 family endonuclease